MYNIYLRRDSAERIELTLDGNQVTMVLSDGISTSTDSQRYDTVEQAEQEVDKIIAHALNEQQFYRETLNG